MVEEKAYAKINLGLEVLRKRNDGYHELSMIMAPLNLHDELFFEKINEDQIIIECDRLKDLKTEDNLVYKAIKLIKDHFNIKSGIKTKIIKNIPEQAGLGGGSADCAASLRAMNDLFHLGLSLDEISILGATLGSDVPFCVYNKTAKVKGRGERIEFIKDMPFAYVILVIPNFQSSTAEVFKRFIVHQLNINKIDKLNESITLGDIKLISKNLFNDLEIGHEQNEIINIKNDLIDSGALGSAMTGSGSTVYGLCLNEKQATDVHNKFNDISEELYGQAKNGRKIIITSIKSNRYSTS